MDIIKRDGTRQAFDRWRIVHAIIQAFLDVDGELYEADTANDIADEIEEIAYAHYKTKPMTVEEIQDLVEDYLMRSERRDVAKAYIRYRYKKEVARNNKDDFVKAIREKLDASNVQNQNANVDEHSFGGRMGEAASLMTKDLALDYLLSPMARENHINNMIYIHDLDAYYVGSHNCLSIPFDDLLAKGFNSRQTDVRPARSINTAFQLVAVIFQLQSLQQFGGVSATHLDWTMVPYVRMSFAKHYKDGLTYIECDGSKADSDAIWGGYGAEKTIIDEDYKKFPKVYKYAMDMTKRELEQAVEGMYHNLNTLQSRSGNQLPFTSINYGTCTSPEGRMVIEALLDGLMNGTGAVHKTSIFPCGIFQCKLGVNRHPGDPNYDLYRKALKCTATRLYPNYANCDWSGNAGYDEDDPCTYFSTMGCRTANGWDVNGLGQRKDGRGNICPVTIILPTIAKMAEEKTITDGNFVTVSGGHAEMADEIFKEELHKNFFELLTTKIYEAKDMLLERFEWICSQDPSSASFMYENHTMAGYIPEEGIRSALKHGTLVIGQLGLAEALQILIGCDHTTEKGMELAKEIEQLFKEKCAKFKEQYSLNFGVYYTPAENLCYTAMKKFKNRYGEIKNVSDHEYFTNSMHVPVWYKMSPFEKIDIESQLTGYSSAGCITYVELEGGVKHNVDAVETIVNYAMDHDIPYFAINVPNDTCLDCGYTDEFNDKCPMCGSTHIQQLRRVTGYLTGNYKTAFNLGKQAEVEERSKHTGGFDL